MTYWNMMIIHVASFVVPYVGDDHHGRRLIDNPYGYFGFRG